MKYIDEYRNKDLIMRLSLMIKNAVKGKYSFMEVCGGHTAAIHRFGIPSLLPDSIRLISGPGCPVCVTSKKFIDAAIAFSGIDGVIIATFGDLLRVPGSFSTLEREKACGADVRVVFSALEALQTARSNPGRKVIFLGIGFETSAPGTAVTVSKAQQEGLENFYLFCSHKIMPPAMEAILDNGTKLNGFICPGHVAAITGASAFNFIPEKYHTGCVVTGFEPADILHSILMLVNQVNNNTPGVEIQYTRAVTADGNRAALDYMQRVFELYDTEWRGFGTIPLSGLRLRKEYERFDAEKRIKVNFTSVDDNQSCICSEILRGIKTPVECTLFDNVCNPEDPVGACMVSNEGACNTFFKYRNK